MALGVPLLISNTKIDKFYFIDNLVSYFRSDDAKDIAKKMLLLFNNPSIRERLVKNALEYIKQNNWKVKQYKYLNIIDKLIK